MGKIKAVFFVILFIFSLTAVCSAADADSLIEEFMNSTESAIDYQSISDNFSLDNFGGIIFDCFKNLFSECSEIFFKILSLILFLTLLDNFDFIKNDRLKTVVASVISAAIMAVTFDYLLSSMQIVTDSIKSAQVFSTAAIPVISALCISSGEPLASTVFSISVSACVNIFQFVSGKLLVPLICIFITLGVSGTFSTDFNLYSLTALIKKFFIWVIGLFTGIFSFCVSMQGMLSKSADNITKKSIQMAVGRLVPMIGGTLSGSLESVFSLAAGTKSYVAILGILIVVIIFLPSICGNLFYGAAMLISRYIADFLKLEPLSKIIGVISDAFFLLSALISACAFMIVVSFLIICTNVG